MMKGLLFLYRMKLPTSLWLWESALSPAFAASTKCESLVTMSPVLGNQASPVQKVSEFLDTAAGLRAINEEAARGVSSPESDEV